MLFKWAYDSKLQSFRNGRSTRLLDRILFKRISSAVVGKKLRLLLCGGAMLSKEVQEFGQCVLCPIIQAYGLTETCAGGTTQLPNQTDTGIVGSVVPCSEIRLVDWLEGGYRSTDRPYPRGEIFIGGDNVALGYYNMPDKTEEDFKVINGIRYFATGDIGEMINGNLKIIDRKKDLVKLQGGEYISLNKVETILKLLSFVDNCCIIADPTKSNCVCLICPNPKRITDLLSEQDEVTQTEVNNLKDINGVNEKSKELNRILEKNSKVVTQLSKEALNHCLSQGLERFEIPIKIKFVAEIWLPDTGFVTDSLKLKRKEIEKYYQSDIEKLYK